MSHYDEEFERQILEASISIRNEYKNENIHIKTVEDANAYINKVKSDYINGDLTENELLKGLTPKSSARLVARLIEGEWVLK